MNHFKCDRCGPPTPNIGHIWVESFLYFSFLTFVSHSFNVIIWFFICCTNLNFFRMFSRFLLWMLLPLLASAMVREKRLYGLTQFIFMEDNCTELELIFWSSVASHFQCVDICHSCPQCQILLPLSICKNLPLPLQQNLCKITTPAWITNTLQGARAASTWAAWLSCSILLPLYSFSEISPSTTAKICKISTPAYFSY